MDFMTLAAPGNGAAVAAWIGTFAGNILLAAAAVRGVVCFVRKNWGDLVEMIVALVVIGALVYAPRQVIDLTLGVWKMVSA
jgi:nitrate reductase alpha subunit